MPHEGTPVGRIQALYRYPVKSTSGQSLRSVRVTEEGLQNDRRWAVYTRDGGIASGKRTRRFRPVAGLMHWASTAEDDGGIPILRSPKGVPYRVDDPAASEALSAAFDQELQLRPESTVQHHDESPLHVLTTSSLAAVSKLAGAMIDHRRFRANIILDTGAEPEFLETGLLGAELRVGSTVLLRMEAGMPRCTMVDQDQADVTAGPKVLKSLGTHHGTIFGLQARARSLGTLHVGDLVTLRRSGL
ncbi:MOSC domain-containing protein [Arthrobacter sp. TMN-37]